MRKGGFNLKEVIKPIDTRNEFQKAIDNMKFQLPTEIEFVKLQAKLAKEQYEALLKEGFTEQQAMQIVTTQPSWK